MAENKLIEDWLMHLPPGYNERAQAHHVAFRERHADRKTKLVEDVGRAVDYGFCWRETPEGQDFWDQVCHADDPTDVTQLPPFPP